MNKQDKSMWDNVKAITDSQVNANATADPDNPTTDAGLTRRGVSIAKCRELYYCCL
jgi:hypothetical protein